MTRIVEPSEIAERFITQYDKLVNGGIEALHGEKIFTSEQIQAIYSTISRDFTGMVFFFSQVASIIQNTMNNRYGENSPETLKAIHHFMMVMFAKFIPALGTLMQENQVLNKMIEMQLQFNDHEGYPNMDEPMNVDPNELFKNLEFKMPDWSKLNNNH